MSNSSQPANPFDIIPESWVIETMTIGTGGLVIQHHLEDPSELAACEFANQSHLTKHFRKLVGMAR
jgi:hypothetical protein